MYTEQPTRISLTAAIRAIKFWITSVNIINIFNTTYNNTRKIS